MLQSGTDITRNITVSTVVVLPAITVPGSLSRGSKPCADQRRRNGPGGNSNRYAPPAAVVALWPAPAPSVTSTCAPETGASGLKTAPKYASRFTMPWTMPVVGGVTTAEEGPVGVSDSALHAVSSGITAQSVNRRTVVAAGLVMMKMRSQVTRAKRDPRGAPQIVDEAELQTRRTRSM